MDFNCNIHVRKSANLEAGSKSALVADISSNKPTWDILVQLSLRLPS